jgi:hypothetical protein
MIKKENKTSEEITRSMRRNAVSIFIEVDEGIAQRISKCLCDGANRIEELESEIAEIKEIMMKSRMLV